MNADAYFTIGKTHTVCQDYAIGIASPCMAVLSDGCSSSPHTDYGARLLSRLAAMYGVQEAAPRAAPIVEALALPPSCLNATLMLAKWDDTMKSVRVEVAGDGVVLARRRDGGSPTIITSDFPSGAPRYPSYDLDPAMRAQYVQEFGGVQHVTTSTGDGPFTQVRTPEDAPHESLRFEFLSSIFDLVLVLSDGALSFHRPVGDRGGMEPVPLAEIVVEMLAVKNYGGEFITRRAKRFLKDAYARGWHHDDDFSVAAIYVGPEVAP